MKTKNEYKCPSKLWTKLTTKQKISYNLFMKRTEDQSLFVKNNVFLGETDWEIIRHNLFAAGFSDMIGEL